MIGFTPLTTANSAKPDALGTTICRLPVRFDSIVRIRAAGSPDHIAYDAAAHDVRLGAHSVDRYSASTPDTGPLIVIRVEGSIHE